MRTLVLALLVVVAVAATGAVGAAGAAGAAGAVRDYARLHSLRRALFYGCASAPARARISSILFEAGVASAFVCLSCRDEMAGERRLFTRERSLAIVDTACAGAAERAAAGGAFDYTTHWLLLAAAGRGGSGGRALAAARALPLTLNSELRLLHQLSPGTWYAYDVYSIEYTKYTPLNVTFYGSYTTDCDEAETADKGEEFAYPAPLILARNESFDEQQMEGKLAAMQARVTLSLQADGGDGGGGGARACGWSVRLERTGAPVARRRRWGHAVALRGSYVLNQKPAHVTDRRYLRARTQLHRDAPPRYFLHVLGFMQDLHQFELTLERAALWGGRRNGSWVGIAGALLAGRADLCAAPMLLKAERFPAVEYSGLVAYTKLPTLFRQPEAAGAPTLAVFTAPLAGAAWAGALLLCALATALLAAAAQLETRFLGSPDNYKINFGEMMLDFVNIFYLDASFRSSQLWGGRCAALVACSLGLLLMQFYSASLLSAVLAPPRAPIRSLRDLLRSELQYKVEDVSYQRQFYADNMEQRDIAELYGKIMAARDPPYIGYDEGLRRVLTERIAFQCTATYSYPVMETWSDEQVCAMSELMVVPRVEHHSAARRASPYRQPLSVMLALVRERGVMARVQPAYYRPRPRCPPEFAAAPRPVGRQFYPALQLLAALGGVAMLLLLVEIIAARVIRRAHEARNQQMP